MTTSFEPMDRNALGRLLVAVRPRLHRYCARMVGSVIDGEDVVQDAIIKAVEALDAAGPIERPEAWLFRIAHNTALDALRRRSRGQALPMIEEVEMVADKEDVIAMREMADIGLRLFIQLPVAQRGCVILMDVLGYSLAEICDIMGTGLPAVKAALHRGRVRLRELAAETADTPCPALSPADRARLSTYVAHFNARDFDAIRAMIADDIRLDLVGRSRMNGKAEVSRYFGNYDKAQDWCLVPGLVEGRPAILVIDPHQPGSAPTYFMLLDWVADKVSAIRDFRHAPYVFDGADYEVIHD